MRTSRAIAIAGLTLTITVSVVGCGSDDPTGAEPTSIPTATSPQSTAPSESDAPNVPADWQIASVKAAQLQVPPDWTLTSNADLSQTMRAPKDEIGISPGAGGIQANVYTTDATEADLEELAKLNEKDLAKDFTTFERLPNKTINGELFFHFRADDDDIWYDQYGTLEPDGRYQVSVIWKFNKADIDRKGAEALIDQIMPTYQVL